MISIRRQIEESESLSQRFQILLKALLGLTSAIPETSLPASPTLYDHCKESLERATADLKDEAPTRAIENVEKVVRQQIGEICRSNKAALDERDAALKDVVSTVATAISGFKSHGELHKSNLTKLADSFDSLSKVEDVTELRRRLKEDAQRLRQSVEQMRRDQEASVQHFETKLSWFQQRLETARKESDIDRLTGLGSRREAERQLQRIPRLEQPVCMLLFDIEGFRQINQRQGALFGDKLLRALAHMLRTKYPEDDCVFRWGADEFLVISEGLLARQMDQCRSICEYFAESGYYTVETGPKLPVTARVAWGAAQYSQGESMEEWYRRAREALEQSRRGTRR